MCITEFDEKVYTEGIREEGREEGLKEGLRALVCSLKDFLPDFESVYEAVVRNKEYAHIPREQVRKYF